ncbi:MAG: carbamoyl-phosphate synthase large subunit [Candidatus Azotimanducaceae bacterium]|jgi:carbamoyl-phosphate synthase large subunit
MQTQENKKIVLVTGIGGPAGVNTVRLLKDEPDVFVIGCDIDENSSGRFFVDVFLVSPNVSEKSEYEAWIRKTVEEHSVDILIPTVHEELPVLLVFKDTLPCTVVMSEAEAIAVGDDKKIAYEWAEKNIPEHAIKWTVLSAWTPQWSDQAQQFIKPRQGRGTRGCSVVSKDEIFNLQKLSLDPESLIVMELVEGIEWTVDAYIGGDGTLVYTVPRERLGLAGGISIKGKTVKHQAVLDATKKVLSTLSCAGPVCVQFKADQEGTPRFIEINPRLSGGLPISVAAGINPVKNMLREHTGERLEEQEWSEVTVLGYYEYKKLD